MTNLRDLAPAYVGAIAPYQPGKPLSELERELGISNAVKLASNENPLGTSPLALQAMRDALATVALYPDGNGFELKRAIAARWRVGIDQVVLGNGSNDVLELVAHAFLAPGAKSVYSQYAFAVYPLATQATGATGVEVPARDHGHDLDAMLAAVGTDTRVVWIANPNNPTGTLIAPDALARFVAAVPAQTIVVLDEAYDEYLDADQRADSSAWIAGHPNLVVSRTFSKAYGLAGLRVGYALASREVADLMNRVRQPFNVNTLAQAAAVAALADEDFVARSHDLNRTERARLERALESLGVDYVRSAGNFVMFDAGDARAVYDALLRRGVIVRPLGNYGLPRHLRVSVGLPHENDRFVAALAEVLGRQPS